MSKTIIVYEEEVEVLYKELREQLTAIFREMQQEVEVMCVRDGADVSEYNWRIKQDSVKYICTFDMAGFQIDTLLEQPGYNICRAMQMHIVLREEYLGLYADNNFALNLFLFVPGNVEYWKRKYPRVVHFMEYEKLSVNTKDAEASARNETILRKMVKDFLEAIES